MGALAVLSFALAVTACVLVIRAGHLRAETYGQDLPQRFHVGHVPRLGGLAITFSLAVTWVGGTWLDGVVWPLGVQLAPREALLLLLVLAPSVAAGMAEDLTQRLPVRLRLAATVLSGALAWGLLDATVSRLGLPWVDARMQAWPWLGGALAVVAVAGLPHAFNIIDGYNGLAGTVALLVCLALAHVALQVGDRALASLVFCLAGATAGFLVWNYLRGLIFAGDGGAYLWGTVIAVVSVLLVQRHPQVTPWFPMLLLIYPVWETLFSIYRKLSRGVSPGMADALHLHQLIYRRVMRGRFPGDASRRMLMRNNRTSPYLWGFMLATVVPAVLFWRNTPVLVAFCGLFVLGYVAGYLSIVRFKVPRWLRP